MTRSPPTVAAPQPRFLDARTPEITHVTADEGSGPRVQALRIHRGEASAVVALRDDEQLVLGRHDAADVVFESPAVSRLHGVLRCEGGRWRYVDNGSRNGSVLKRAGQETPEPIPAHKPTPLVPGDVVELGTAESRVELLVTAPEEIQPPAAEDDATQRSPAARAFAERVGIAARTRVPVFLLGPSGCGKTHAARWIHQRSRSRGQFVPINCARLPQESSALHSELLGHVRGAFTGAESARTGKLVHANGGTLFLDEVESLPALAQGFLLDVLEGSGDLSPLGAREVRSGPLLFRLISASKHPLSRSGLRPDLCERLAEGHLWTVPTLEERKEDIPGLVRLFASEQSRMLGVPVEVTSEAVERAAGVSWPGQIRQLRATVMVLAQMGLARLHGTAPAPQRIVLRRPDLDAHLDDRARAFGTLEPLPPLPALSEDGLRIKADARALTRPQLERALESAGGNQSEAARSLGIARNTLRRKLEEFGMEEAPVRPR